MFNTVLVRCVAFIKMVCASCWVLLFGNRLREANLWLICEKLPEARDNGYHLFAYLRDKHKDTQAYYVIEKKSVDLYKVQNYGNIIYANSFKHYVYYLCAKFSISSQPGGAVPTPRNIVLRLPKIIRKDQRVIFLQHGIIKDELSHSFDYSKTNYALFSCSSKREQEFLAKYYGYPLSVVKNIGLCRFDNLIRNNNCKKQVLVMPTFRKWLLSNNIPGNASESEILNFINSEYYSEYVSLLCEPRLLEYLKRKGYTIVFYPHYAMQPYISCFEKCSSDTVIIADRWHYDVQQLLMESSILITDYSSVFFDFAYMEKPEIFFQFDEVKYRSSHYKKGYFDYRKDGFGPVFNQTEELIKYLMECVENKRIIENAYLNRISSFFDIRDNKNCERTYEAINMLE